jgi:hypothetical protein
MLIRISACNACGSTAVVDGATETALWAIAPVEELAPSNAPNASDIAMAG